jgi:hypothetical protein
MLHYAWQRSDRNRSVNTFANKQRRNKIIDIETSLSDEIAQSLSAAQTTRT